MAKYKVGDRVIVGKWMSNRWGAWDKPYCLWGASGETLTISEVLGSSYRLNGHQALWVADELTSARKKLTIIIKEEYE